MRKQTRDLLDGNSDSTPGKRGAPSHQPTEKNKATVLKLAKLGVPQNIISIALAIDVKTLHKYYSNQLDEGKVHVVESLLQTAQQRAKKSDAILIFLLKTIAGLKESEIVDDNGRKAKIVEIRVTGKGERIAKTIKPNDDDDI